MTNYPNRIICLTEETTETLYLLGQQDRIVGVSGYTVRPPEARLKPKVSAFISAKFDKIEALRPDLVLASWCGKKVQPSRIRERTGWHAVSAVAHDRIFEVKSTYILQPGPAALTDGVRQIHEILCRIQGIAPAHP